jgi:hypothetical protein
MKLLTVSLNERVDLKTLANVRALEKVIGARIIAGGAARQLYYGKGFGSTDIDCFDDPNPLSGFVCYGVSAWAYTYKFYNIGTVQIIRKYLLGLEAIFETFDYNCCCFAYLNGRICFTPEAIEDCENRR